MIIVENEYIYENHPTLTPSGQWEIIYEPMENLPVTSIIGCVYLISSPRKICGFFFGASEIIHVTDWIGLPKVIQGTFNSRNGVIILQWDKYPGEHALCISYHTDEDLAEEIVTSNWAQEGF